MFLIFDLVFFLSISNLYLRRNFLEQKYFLVFIILAWSVFSLKKLRASIEISIKMCCAETAQHRNTSRF